MVRYNRRFDGLIFSGHKCLGARKEGAHHYSARVTGLGEAKQRTVPTYGLHYWPIVNARTETSE